MGAISWSSLRSRVHRADVERRTEPADAGVHDHLGAELLDELDDPSESRRAFVARHVGHRFGANADDDLSADPLADVVDQRRWIERHRHRTHHCDQSRIAPFDDCREEVHRRRADEGSDEQVVRSVVEITGSIALFDPAAVEHGNAVAHRHRLDLIVRDVDRCGLELALQPADLGAHLHAQLGVEVRQRLVHQERRWLAHDRPAHRHSLALTARELPGLAIEHRLELQRARRRVDTLFASCAGTPASFNG